MFRGCAGPLRQITIAGLLGLLLPSWSWAAEHQPPAFDFPLWTVVPFVALLLGIAVLPVLAAHFWHSNARKALVAVALSLPVVAFLYYDQQTTGQPSLTLVKLALIEYGEFIVLLASLYTVSGGIVLEGSLKPTTLTNACFLVLGSCLANLIGTTGASMLLIRPFLRINSSRHNNRHLPVFFIFMVSNLGGLLTPLGDPPLYLGYIHGVDFFWTLSLWRQWLIANGAVLVVFVIWDFIAASREPNGRVDAPATMVPLRMRGAFNFLFLGGILIAVLLQSEKMAAEMTTLVRQALPCPDLHLHHPWGSAVMASMAVLSLLTTPQELRQANDFNWDAILEVAILFFGIFVTMVPPLMILKTNGARLGLNEPWEYFWLSGSLSSFLDNAPTYLVFATVAAGKLDFEDLMSTQPLILQAISCGAVFMGANTYIGNGPNFMVKAIADGAGYKTPSFFGYMLYSCLILLPIFGLLTFLFFLP